MSIRMPTEPRAVAIIPARWASSRFPGKPLARIRDKPMVQWVAEQAGKARLVSEVIVATDDVRIADAVREFGGNAVMTSPDHPSGTDRIAEVAEGIECDIVVNVQGDEPLIPPENIDAAVEALRNAPEVPVSTLMLKIDTREEIFDPNVTKVVTDQNGFALYFSRAPIPFDRDGWPGIERGTDTNSINPDLVWYKHIGLYAYRKTFLMEFPRLGVSKLETAEKLEQLRILENGYSIKTALTDKNSIGVDCPEDIVSVERMLEEALK